MDGVEKTHVCVTSAGFGRLVSQRVSSALPLYPCSHGWSVEHRNTPLLEMYYRRLGEGGGGLLWFSTEACRFFLASKELDDCEILR